MADRLLIVSNRLPISASVTADGIRAMESGGGLATGLRPWHERSRGVWIGWPGDVSGATAAQQQAFDDDLDQQGIVPVHLSTAQVDGYYHGFANRVLWPAFHSLVDRVATHAAGWDAYREVNERFADAVAREYRHNDTIWVHDYQLMLLPALLRQRLPRARIGFFLHIPFPSPDVFRILPWRREILHGLLGADLVGFHTRDYMRHFRASLLAVGAIAGDGDIVYCGGRAVEVGAFPMGIDAATFARLAADTTVAAQAEAIKRDAGGRRILLGVDRLDYTKGIPQRLEALETLLARCPERRDSLRYIQIAVPSRGEVDAYQQFRREVEAHVGRINGAYGTLGSAPIHYLHRSVSPHELVALYRAADVMLVTPLRDGMNLVAKEYAASRVDDEGVLILSELAGASAELHGAMTVNPYDVEGVAATVDRALSLTATERRVRMRSLRRHVCGHDVHAWAGAFLGRLRRATAADAAGDAVTAPLTRQLRQALSA